MSNQRTHYVTTTDGVTIGGTVHGQGPPLVFLQGARRWRHRLGPAAGAPDRPVHLPSAEHAGPWPQRRSPRPQPGSAGRRHPRLPRQHRGTDRTGGLVRRRQPGTRAAAQSDAVDAVAPFEPAIPSLMDEQEQAVIGDAVARMGDPRRRARRPPDPSRGARRGTYRVLRTSPEAGLTLAQRGPVTWPDPPARSARRYVPLSLEGSYASRDRANFTSSLI